MKLENVNYEKFEAQFRYSGEDRCGNINKVASCEKASAIIATSLWSLQTSF